MRNAFLFKKSKSYFVNTIKTSGKKFISFFLRLCGFNLLNRSETFSFLNKNIITIHKEDHIMLSEVKNWYDKTTIVSTACEAISHEACVWLYSSRNGKAVQLPYGAVYVQSKVLCTDFNQSGFYQSLLTRNKRKTRSVKTLIGPWSQYHDGIFIRGFYDFVIHIAAKLSRIKNSLSPAEFSEAVISYPLFNDAYETEYLELLGVKPSQIEDSRYCKIEFERVILCNTGDMTYPNSADILLLKKYVESNVKVQKSEKRRIYISRSGSRRVENEDQLIELLKKFNFKIIEDVPRTVREQIEIYKNASFIIGPHGASFMNVIWCDPGTHLFELFSPNYRRDHFRYLAKIVDMNYSAYYYKAGTNSTEVEYALLEDLVVSIPEIESCLNDFFEHDKSSETVA